MIHKDVQLLKETGMGKTKEQQAVKRVNAREFMRLRLEYLEITDDVPFTPHEQCHWVDDDRGEMIRILSMKAMELGDVSSKERRSAPLLPAVECAPIEKNEETRWKSKAMQENRGLLDEVTEKPPETNEEIMAKSRLILNKVSWTSMQKMTEQFYETAQIETNEDVRKSVIHLLIVKSQIEHHFGPLYAHMCGTISKRFKPFKKELLTQCQDEFETDTADKIAEATKGTTDKEAIQYQTLLIRKGYLGHMKFLGELYKHDVVKLNVMMHCLDELLKENENDDAVECFAELMTTMGHKLDGHARQNNKPFDWERVVALRKSGKISNRTKFLLQDLLDLKDNGWVSRRKEEKAVNLNELHKEIAKEEKAAKQGNNNRRPGSQQNLRRSVSVSSVPVMDGDGFVQISNRSFRKVSSKVEILAPEKEGGNGTGGPPPPVPKKSEMRRSVSQPANMKQSEPPGSPPPKAGKVPLSPDECGEKAKNMLKEFFVGGDADDAVLTVDEIVRTGTAGDLDRGAKVVESAVFLIMEMKEAEAIKCASVLCRAHSEGKIPAGSFGGGLRDPLEFLDDVEIDAPLAGNHAALFFAEAARAGALELAPTLEAAPREFRESGKPGLFCARVLRFLGRPGDGGDLTMIGNLMTGAEKEKHGTAKAIFDAV